MRAHGLQWPPNAYQVRTRTKAQGLLPCEAR